MSIYKMGIEQGIKILISDNLEEGIPKERILQKLEKHFELTAEQARSYFAKYSGMQP